MSRSTRRGEGALWFALVLVLAIAVAAPLATIVGALRGPDLKEEARSSSENFVEVTLASTEATEKYWNHLSGCMKYPGRSGCGYNSWRERSLKEDSDRAMSATQTAHDRMDRDRGALARNRWLQIGGITASAASWILLVALLSRVKDVRLQRRMDAILADAG